MEYVPTLGFSGIDDIYEIANERYNTYLNSYNKYLQSSKLNNTTESSKEYSVGDYDDWE